MHAELQSGGASASVITITFEPQEFERAMIESFISRRTSDSPFPVNDIMLTTESVIERDADNQLILRDAVEKLLRANYASACEEAKVAASSNPVIKDISGDFGLPLVLSVSAQGQIQAKDVSYKGLEVKCQLVDFDEDIVEKRLADARKHYGASDDEGLAERMGAYKDAHDMREQISHSLEERIEELNHQLKRRAAIDALIDVNGASASRSEIDAYVDSVMSVMRSQLGSDEYDQLFATSPDKASALRKVIEAEESYMPSLIPLLDAIADELGLVPGKAQRLAEIEEQRSNAMDSSSMRSAEEILDLITADDKALASLDAKVKRTMALDHVVDITSFDVDGYISIEEAEAKARTSWH